MGDVADMMVDGTFCQMCGEWLGDDEAPGHPRWCPECAPADTHPSLVKDPDEHPTPGGPDV